MMDIKSARTQSARKSIYIKRDHHTALSKRNSETGIPLQNLIDEALELGMRMKRWLPEAEETAAA
jgi:DNA-binding transcriptional regulator YhcF (GntR family)